MCGRYGRRPDKQRIAEWMRTHNTNVFDDNDTLLAPSYNIAPQTLQPVVKLARDTGQRKLAAIRLGLIPYCVLVESGHMTHCPTRAKAEVRVAAGGTPAQ